MKGKYATLWHTSSETVYNTVPRFPMRDAPTHLEIVRLPSFERSAEGVIREEEVRTLEQALIGDPRAGDVLPGTGGVRKIRLARPGGGKRGGARVAYLYVEVKERIYLLLAFAKNEQANLTAQQKKRVRELVEQIKKGG